MPTPVLETERLILRPPTLADAPAIQRRFGRWSIISHLSMQVPWPYPPDGAEQFLRDTALPMMERGELLLWGLVPRSGPDEVCGLIDFRFTPGIAGNRGFWLADELQGRGLMTEAIVAVQDHLFFELGLERIVVANARNNPASRRVKEKTGARLLGTAQVAHHDGEGEADLWEVTRDAWAAFRGRSGGAGP